MISNIPNNVLSALDKCIDQVKSNLRPYVSDTHYIISFDVTR